MTSEPTLIFPDTWQLDGFTTNVTSRQAGEPEPVIRELLQNGLDAAIREAGRDCAEIHFTISQHPLSLLPGFDVYTQAFEAAKQGDAKRKTNDVRSAVQRIEDVLSDASLSMLSCRDNGVGLDEGRMTALLSEGQSDKARQGAGSYGLGHLTAFAASDLRFVLYAGLRGTQRIASGHAILASHKLGNTRHSSHGYWKTLTDIFSLEDRIYPRAVPQILASEFDKIDGSGSIVSILGFNYFHNDAARAVDDICRVAALNFLGAIYSRKMVVHVRDEQSDRHQVVDADSLEQILREFRNQRRAPRPDGSPASKATVLSTPCARGVKSNNRSIVQFACTSARSRRTRPNVHASRFFRDGMWITNNAPHLETGAFTGVLPFDAVVSLSDADPEDHTEFYDLVRNAEGPEHRGLTKMREMPAGNRKTLRGKLEQLADLLREEAGAHDAGVGFSPAGFAVFGTGATREAQEVPRVRHRMTADDQDDLERAADPYGQSGDGPTVIKGTSPKPSPRPSRSPSPGTAVKMRRSVLPIVDADGRVRRLLATLKIDSRASADNRVGLRVYAESGSDETCEQPIAPIWQPIRYVRVNDQNITADDQYEVSIPAPTGADNIEIELDQPAVASAQFEIDVVRRARARARS